MAVDDPVWPQICFRKNDEMVTDGTGCTQSAYNNMTRYVEPFFDAFTDDLIQKQIKYYL
jgi:hypothetical protein